jgi:PAS domain S-box-containing protein
MTAAVAPPTLIDFEALFARSPNPYVVLDRDLKIIWMNEAYLQVTMRSREEIVGRRMFDAFPSDEASESFRLLHGSFERVLANGAADEIALIRYDIAAPDGGVQTRFWSATHTPVLDDGGAVAYILQHTVDVTELHGLRRLRDQMGVVERAQAVQARNLDLTEEATQLRTLFEQAPGFVAILSGPEHRFVVANNAYRALVGQRDLIGKSIAEALPEVLDQGFNLLLDRVRSTGMAYVASRAKVHLDSGRLGPSGDTYYLNFVYQPILGPDGSVTGIFVQGHDVTQEVEAEERQELLINELNHRVKNTLSIVQGLALQSFRRIENSESAQRTFESRLNALAAAHTLLTDHNWESASLSSVIDSALKATAGQAAERVQIQAPDLTLGPQMAVSLAMIIHELSTNAIKYGALSADAGHVDVTCDVSKSGEQHLLTILWREGGGPRVPVPTRRGFGTRLIERGMSSELRGAVNMEFLPEGLRCTITAYLASLEA